MTAIKGLSGYAGPVPPQSDSQDAPNFFFTKNHLAHPQIEVGEYTYGRPRVLFLPAGVKLKIGKFCSIAWGVDIFLGGEHRQDWISMYPFAALQSEFPSAAHLVPESSATKGDVVIGNDVWIGLGTTIVSGVTIGDGAVIGARAVVTKDIPPYTVAAGNPAKVIKKRFDDATIDMLMRIQWWNWPIEKIREHADTLCSGDFEKLKTLEFVV